MDRARNTALFSITYLCSTNKAPFLFYSTEKEIRKTNEKGKMEGGRQTQIERQRETEIRRRSERKKGGKLSEYL